ncbi:hypothetical protein KIL84_003745 [Mauremys mutica]|uniref:Uncharacterized protein n=1 Tax=Mauremys mutica TaxID=74926 RepID=A0A9D3WUD8_9SAUR|nr:hypothetical protein KIL84_003745 [Mauremys mutica]
MFVSERTQTLLRILKSYCSLLNSTRNRSIQNNEHYYTIPSLRFLTLYNIFWVGVRSSGSVQNLSAAPHCLISEPWILSLLNELALTLGYQLNWVPVTRHRWVLLGSAPAAPTNQPEISALVKSSVLFIYRILSHHLLATNSFSITASGTASSCSQQKRAPPLTLILWLLPFLLLWLLSCLPLYSPWIMRLSAVQCLPISPGLTQPAPIPLS